MTILLALALGAVGGITALLAGVSLAVAWSRRADDRAGSRDPALLDRDAA